MKISTFLAASFSLLLCVLITSTAGAMRYSLALSAQGNGTVTPDNTNSPYSAGVTITISAIPGNGWYFDHWTGNASGSTNPLEVTMNSDLVITGNFLAYPAYSLTLATNGEGTITLNPPGGTYFSNTTVTVQAVPAAGWVFAGWSGTLNGNTNPASLAVDTNVSLTGTFAQLPAFDVQPASVATKPGSTVSFSADAVGTAPISYQWFFSFGTLTNATGTTLTLKNASPAQAGNYWVVATNNYGSATSYVASLTLTNMAGPTNVVSSPNEASLLAAIAQGGWVGIGFNGTMTLTNTITITNNVVLDGNGFVTTLSGGHAVQLFYVAGSASLTISNLTLADGNCLVTNGPPGTPADAGGIYNDGGTVTLVGCTLTNNFAQSLILGGLSRGGAVFNNGGTVSLYLSAIAGNTAVGGGSGGNPNAGTDLGLGGAIYNTNGTVVIAGCSVIQNQCESASGLVDSTLAMGGALFQTSGTTTISNSRFILNQVLGSAGNGYTGAPASPAYGGAAAVTGGTLTIDHSQFITNRATGGAGFESPAASAYGGGVYCAAVGTVNDSTFVGNQALGGGSGISSKGSAGCGGGIYNGGSLTLNGCSLNSNFAEGGPNDGYNSVVGGDGFGAGIYNAALCAATNCTVALNFATGAPSADMNGPSETTSGDAIGGGVFNSAGALFIGMNLTLASNSCSSPPGSSSAAGFAAGSQIANTNGILQVHNSIIAYGTNSNAYGPIADDGYNICSDASAKLDGGSSFNCTDPQLAPLGNYGGPTLCLALLANSPAIDNADPNDFPGTDQRGGVRPFGAGPDIGAYEYGSTLPGGPNLAVSASGTNVVVSFAAFPPYSYRLQCSTDLKSWSDLCTNGPVGTSTNISQTVSKQGFNSCFFRLRMQ